MWEELSTRLNDHIQQNAAKFAEYDQLLKGKSIMADEVKITNAGDPNAAILLAAMGNKGGGDGLFGSGGGGLLGGLVLGSLLRNGGLGGPANDVGGVVTPSLLSSSLAQVTDSQQNTTVLQTLGDIKAAIPLAESQVQLALSVTQADINSNITNGNAAITKAVSDTQAALLAAQNTTNVNVLQTGAAVKESVSAYGVANLTATKDAQAATVAAINGSTKEILAALTAQNTDTLQRQLAVAENALIEQRTAARSREVEINVTQQVNQTQQQAQQQQQFANLTNLLLDAVQNIRATNQAINIGSGLQVPTQTNSSANTRVN